MERSDTEGSYRRQLVTADPSPQHRWRVIAHGWFWAWLAVGFALALGLVSALGLLVLAPAALIAAAMATRAGIRRWAWGLLSGAGALALLVAWIQRRGPGTVTWHTATASGSDQYLDPRPWLVAGLVLVVAGVVAQLRQQRGGG